VPARGSARPSARSARPNPDGNGRRRQSSPKARAGGSPGRLTRFRSAHPLATALVPVAVVVLAIGSIVAVKATDGSAVPLSSHVHPGAAAAAGDTGATPLPATVAAALSVPVATLDAVGSPASVALPTRTANGSSTVARGADGKPLVTYIGAEYCPYCAAERWALAVALSRFGSFQHLSATHSSSTDVFPDTQTLSFYESTYTSPYLDFASVEEATNHAVGGTYGSLQAPTTAQSALMAQDDPTGSIPFLDIGGRYVVIGASYSPQVLQGLSQQAIAAALSNPSSQVAQAIDGTANVITAAISAITGNQPVAIGNSPTIAAIARQLGA
jgi:hypothetical protein